jgi:hypothetical protein
LANLNPTLAAGANFCLAQTNSLPNPASLCFLLSRAFLGILIAPGAISRPRHICKARTVLTPEDRFFFFFFFFTFIITTTIIIIIIIIILSFFFFLFVFMGATPILCAVVLTSYA